MKHPQIPKTCKAGVVVNPGPDFHLEVQEVDVPGPNTTPLTSSNVRNVRIDSEEGPNDLVNCTGLCMSDVHYMLKDLPLRVRVDGTGVKDWRIGDPAGIKPKTNTCHNCELCWNGIEQWCRKSVSTGIQVGGTYQQ